MSENGNAPNSETGHCSDTRGSEERDVNGAPSVVSRNTWSQYTSVWSPRSPDSPPNIESLTQPTTTNWSTRAQGHGEPPEEIFSENAFSSNSGEEPSAYSSGPLISVNNGGVNGLSGTIDRAGLEEMSALGPSGQGGAVDTPSPMRQIFDGEQLTSLEATPQPMNPPTRREAEDEEDEEQQSPQFLSPENQWDMVMGNGPAPTDQGNIGDSIGTVLNPPNGI